jgi:hypothetical protein
MVASSMLTPIRFFQTQAEICGDSIRSDGRVASLLSRRSKDGDVNRSDTRDEVLALQGFVSHH